MTKSQTTLIDEIEKILAPAIDVRAPYAKVMVAKLADLKVTGHTPQPDNPTLPKLLRAIARGTDAQRLEHSVIFNLAADKCEEYDTLKQVVRDYLSEVDNPVPDYAYRATVRDRLRRLVGAPAAFKPEESKR